MSASIHELVWAAMLLDGCPNVDVLTVRVESDEFLVAHDRVPAITVDVHARSQADAERLSGALRLGEVEGRVSESEYNGLSVWRTWQGWAADGSRDAAVWVSVTGSDRSAGSAAA
jgi:hypothetical protein